MNREKLADICDLYEEGYPRNWIAREVGVKLEWVNTVLRVAGVEAPFTPEQVEPEVYDQIQDALTDGWPVTEIVRTLGVQMETIKRHFPEDVWPREKNLWYARELLKIERGLKDAKRKVSVH